MKRVRFNTKGPGVIAGGVLLGLSLSGCAVAMKGGVLVGNEEELTATSVSAGVENGRVSLERRKTVFRTNPG